MVFEKMNKKVIYTALFGDYDELKDPTYFDGWDYVCFTDQENLDSDIWNIVLIQDRVLPGNILNRMYKWLPHKYLKNYDISLYIDTNIMVIQNPDYFLEKYLHKSILMAIAIHPVNSCIYVESSGCISAGKSTIEDTLDQMRLYNEEGFPKNFGMAQNNIIFRKHNEPEVVTIMENVWEHIQKWQTKRDQLSLFYIFWKTNFTKFKIFDETVTMQGQFFEQFTHKAKLNRTLLQRLKGKFTKRKNKKNYRAYMKLFNELMND